jgi:ribosomal protein L16 Arg81 hydroxylase
MDIERVSKLSRSDFEKTYLAREQPVIITNAVDHWESIRTWTPQGLASRFGDMELPVEVLPEDKGDDFIYTRDNMRLETMALRRFVELSECAGARYYMPQVETSQLIDGMREAFGPMTYLPASTTTAVASFWLGPSGARTPLHFDLGHNLIVQVSGRKRWLLFPKHERKLLYTPTPALGHFSPITPEAPDLQRYPKYAKATPIEFILEPGEILFVPSRWPHYVRSLDASISLNYFFGTPGLSMRITLERIWLSCVHWVQRVSSAGRLLSNARDHGSFV